MEVLAAGSGIPEIKCFLQLDPMEMTWKDSKEWHSFAKARVFENALCQSCRHRVFRPGPSLSLEALPQVVAGLPCGKEGPMIHSGAIVGAMVTCGPETLGAPRLEVLELGAAFATSEP